MMRPLFPYDLAVALLVALACPVSRPAAARPDRPPMRWESLRGSWSEGIGCSNKASKRWTFLENSFRSAELTCAIESRRPNLSGWSLFLQCQRAATQPTLMGDLYVLTSEEIKIQLTEYRAATYDDGVDVRLYRCKD